MAKGHKRQAHCSTAAAVAATAAGCAMMLAAPAHAADSVADVQAVVLRPNTLVNVDDLDFGSAIIGATGGTISISATTNARTSSGGVTTIGGGATRASFQGTGANLLMIVTGSNSATLARVGGGAPSITASLTRARVTGTGTVALPNTAIIFGSGIQTFFVGGTLTVPANQPDGDYSGTFTLTVNYI